jgi:hypothetical protein
VWGEAHKEALVRRCSRGACEAMLVRRCWIDYDDYVDDDDNGDEDDNDYDVDYDHEDDDDANGDTTMMMMIMMMMIMRRSR